MRWYRRLFRILLLAYPKRIREERGDDMWLTFERHLRAARRAGRFAALDLWRRELIALWRGGRRARVFAREQRRAYREPGSEPAKNFMAFGMSWLDFKLGFRMLIKYPGLTVVGGLAMAFAIFTGAGTFEFLTQVVHPVIPLPEGDRIVGIRLLDAATGRTEGRASFDLTYWREGLESVEDVGAFGTLRRNFVTGDGPGSIERLAQISASAFTVAGVPPHLGRFLSEDDERPGAQPVVVIGYGVWQSRFGADPDVIGKIVRVGRVQTTVVGVMPEGFAFPVAHSLWTPLQTEAQAYGPRAGPGIQVFGRLAPGATLVGAQAELTALGDGIAIEFEATHEHLRPQVLPYARAVFWAVVGVPASISSFLLSTMIMSSNLPVVLFLILVCGNIALLMFARAVAREGEMVVRSALGASRGRIVSQLFAEALVLTAAAAVVGLGAVNFGLRSAFGMIETELGQLPFWFHPSLSFRTMIYAGLLTVLAATVAGVLPALKVTRGVGAQLRRGSAGGGGYRFGGLWTAVIVTQIAVTVAVPLITVAVLVEAARVKVPDIGFPAADYLAARLEMDWEGGPGLDADSARVQFRARYQASVLKLEESLLANPQVAGVTFTERLPRMYHPWRQIEVDGGAAPPPDERGHRLGSTSVEVDYFRTLGVDVRSGRDFNFSDLDTDPGVVIVNESFVRQVLGGRNPIGRRVRYFATEAFRSPDQDPGPWLEIVGVVEDLGTISGYGPQGMYHPAAIGDIYPVHVAVQVKGGAELFTPRLQSATLAVDPTLRLHDPMTLEKVTDAEQQFYAFWNGILLAVTSIALMLSLGGIYSIMSFTVSQRTREIGIRVALGSNRPRVAGAVLRRPISQVGLGILSGGGLIVAVLVNSGESVPLSDLGLLALYVAFMTGVCMLACIVPTRRALSIEPVEALRVDG